MIYGIPKHVRGRKSPSPRHKITFFGTGKTGSYALHVWSQVLHRRPLHMSVVNKRTCGKPLKISQNILKEYCKETDR
jgi:hypothetical protein